MLNWSEYEDGIAPGTHEDFEPGQHVTFTKTFTDEDVQRFIAITT